MVPCLVILTDLHRFVSISWSSCCLRYKIYILRNGFKLKESKGNAEISEFLKLEPISLANTGSCGKMAIKMVCLCVKLWKLFIRALQRFKIQMHCLSLFPTATFYHTCGILSSVMWHLEVLELCKLWNVKSSNRLVIHTQSMRYLLVLDCIAPLRDRCSLA